MTTIDKAQRLALEGVGFLLICAGGLGLFNLAVPLPFFSEAGIPVFLTLLAIGSLLSGYRTIPRLLMRK